MPFELEELEKKIKQIDEYKKNIEALKLNDKYKDYEADLNALRAYKLAIVEKFVNNMQYIKDSAKDFAEFKLNSLREQLNAANQDINEHDTSLQDIYAGEENEEEVNEYFEDLYGTEELENDRQQINRQISSYENYVNDPSWMLQRAFEKNVKFDEGTGYSPQFFSRGICLDSYKNNFLDYKNEVGKINIESFLSVVAEYMSDNFVESNLDDIELPKFSDALLEYSETYINPYDVIPNLKTQQELDEMKEEVENIGNIDQILRDKNSEEYNKYKEYQRYDTIKKATERNAKEIKNLLCGLTTSDGEKYTKRLGEIIAILAEDSEAVVERKIPTIGLQINDKDDYHNYSLMADYVKELFRRTEVFEANSVLYTDGVDFEKIANDAKAKYHGKVSEERVHKFYDSLHKTGRDRVSDRATLYSRINGKESESDRIKEYQNIIKECLNGTSSLSGYDKGKRLAYNTENIGKISADLKNIYNEEYEEQSQTFRLNNQGEVDADLIPKSFNSIGINPENEKQVCEGLLDGDALANEMLLKFNNELNLYRVEGNEKLALENKEDYEDTPNYQRALAKTEGLRCDKNSPLLNDAIATYGRLKDVHDNRRLYWLFHPFKNAHENRALKEMKNTLQTRYGFTNQELNAKVQEVKANATDNINKNFVKNNKENYQALLENQKNNADARKKIITDKLVAIDNEINIKMSNVTFIQSEKLKQGAYIDNVDLSPKKNEMELNEFINHLAKQQAYLKAMNEKPIGGAGLSEEEQQREAQNQLRKEIEGYVDFEGFEHDEAESYSDKAKEVELMIKFAKATDKDQIKMLKDQLDSNNKLNELHKQRRELNSKVRLNKFDQLVSENKDSLENKEIANAIDENKIKADNVLFNKNIKALNEKIEDLEIKNALQESFDESFNKFLDKDMLQNNQEEQTINKLKEKFVLNLDDVSDEKQVEEVKEKQPVIEEEHIEL